MLDDLLSMFSGEEGYEQEENRRELDFHCKNCGDIHQDDVVFLCNTCESKEMIQKDGSYICPQCLTKGQNFMCMECGSKEVRLKTRF